MKLKPQPLGWIAALCTVIFIAAGVFPVNDGQPNTIGVPLSCGSVWNKQGIFSSSCNGTHLTAVIVMSFATVVGLVCIVLFAIMVLPGAVRAEKNAAVDSRVQTTAAPPGAPQRIEAPAGWYIDPHDSSRMRWWTGDLFSDATKPRTD